MSYRVILCSAVILEAKPFASRDEMILSDDHVNKCPHEEQLSGLYNRVSGLAPCKSKVVFG
jgi:hypothetical protein